MKKSEKAYKDVIDWEEYKKNYYHLVEKDKTKTRTIIFNNILVELKHIEWNIEKVDTIKCIIDNIAEEIQFLQSK